MMVVMALVTTAMAAPLLGVLRVRSELAEAHSAV
jgi:hypothetical protein